VLNRSVDPGDLVVPLTSYQPGTELAVVADMNDLFFKGTVDEIDVGKLAWIPTLVSGVNTTAVLGFRRGCLGCEGV
jgi:hypothetical protein